MTCKKHPRYRGIRRPRSNCLDCWKIYAETLNDELATLRLTALPTRQHSDEAWRKRVEELEQERGGDTHLDCSICGNHIFGAAFGAGDGVGQEFAHPECFYRRERNRLKDLLDEANARARDLEAWVHDLQSGMYINCVYCGHRYGPKECTPTSRADVLKQHIEVCPKHPMSALKRQLASTQMDTERLDWWQDHLNYEHGTDYESGEVVLYRVTGNINDREWHEVARGDTLRAVLDDARARKA